MNILKKNYFDIIIFIIPISFIIGIAVTEFFVLLSIVIFLILNKDLKIFKDLKVIFLIFFAIYISLMHYFRSLMNCDILH